MPEPKSPCKFCRSADALAEYCENCAKFFNTIAQQQDYMFELGTAQTSSLYSFLKAKCLVLEYILSKEIKNDKE